jgi:hypothetical protein
MIALIGGQTGRFQKRPKSPKESEMPNPAPELQLFAGLARSRASCWIERFGRSHQF